jgi:hypothetical protein
MPAITQRPLARVSTASVGIASGAAAPHAWLPSSGIPVVDCHGGLAMRVIAVFIGLRKRGDP